MPKKPPRDKPPDHNPAREDAPALRAPELAPYWHAAVIESAGDAIFTETLDGVVASWNGGAERLFGYAAAEVVGRPAAILTPEGRAGEEPAVLARVRAGGPAEHYETVRRRKDGTLVDISLTVSAVRGPGGGVVGTSQVARDITERRRAEEALRRREEELTDFVENSAVGLHWVAADGTIVWANQAELDLLGYEREEYVGRHISEFHDDPEAISDILARLRADETLHGYEARLRRKDGSIRHVLISSNVRRRDGEFLHTRCFTRDITERRQAEESLRLYGQVLDSMVEGVSVSDERGFIIYTNPAEDEMFGYARGELVGQHVTVQNAYAPEENERIVREVIEQLKAKGVWSGEWSNRRKDGTPFTTFARITALEISGRKHWVCVQEDITEHKRAEAELRATEHRFTMFMENLPGLAWIKDLEGRYVYANEAATRAFGVGRGQLYGRTDEEIFPPETAARFRENDRQALRGGAGVQAVEVLEQADGPHYSIVNKFPILGPGREQLMVAGVAIDITEQKRIEEEKERLLASEQRARAAAEEASRLKDEFLATMSHELRTPLTAVLGWTHMLRTGQFKGPDTARALETIERNARAQAQLIDDLLDVSRIVTGKLRLDARPVAPDSFIEAAVEALRPAAEAKGVRVQKIIDTGVVSVSGDPVRLQQVVWNLLSNAIKFTPKGGRVQIKLQRINSHVEITVADTGAGISHQFLPHAFDRFRQADMGTTRQHGGLGLGLSIVRHLVELHGGTVRAESPGEGRGSTFTVLLPVAPVYQTVSVQEPARRPAAKDAPPPYDGLERLDGLKVLVVDDEADARELLRAALEQSGAGVRVAGSVEEALKAVGDETPDLLISDIGMPGQDGYDLIRRLRQLPAESGGRVPAIALTAYARTEDRLQAIRAGYQMHVPKPVEMAELVAVAASLARRGL